MKVSATRRGAEGGVIADVREAFARGHTRSLDWRTAQLRGVEKICRERESDIADALASDLGRPHLEAWMGDIASTKTEASFARKHLKSWMRRTRTSIPLVQRPARAWIQYEPLGVVLIIGPWNYPFYLTMAPVVAAVAAGNGVVIKPSELAPATSSLISELVPQYLDSTTIRVVLGGAQKTQELLAEGYDHVFFTGGTEVGRKVMTAAAATLTPVTLELGGKCPAVVAADADIDVAARRIAYTKLINSGQTCIAPDYVLAEEAIVNQFVPKVTAYLRKFASAPSLRIVNDHHFDRLVSMIGDMHGQIVTGGDFDRAALRIEPTVILDPDPSDRIMAEEIFGPVLPIISVKSIDAAVKFVNSREKPLALYVFTQSSSLARKVIDRAPSGGAVINHAIMHCLVPQLPFGGVGASGIGAYHGKWGFEALSHRRAVLAKSARPDPGLIYPPYSSRAVKVLRRLL